MSSDSISDSSSPLDPALRSKAVNRLLREQATPEQLADEYGVSANEIVLWKDEYLNHLKTAEKPPKKGLQDLGRRAPKEPSADAAPKKKFIPQPRGKRPPPTLVPSDHLTPEERLAPLAKKIPAAATASLKSRKMNLGPKKNPLESSPTSLPKERPAGTPPLQHTISDDAQSQFDRNWQRLGEGPPPPVVRATFSERVFTWLGSLPLISWLLHGGRFDRAPWMAILIFLVVIAVSVVLFLNRHESTVPPVVDRELVTNVRLSRAEVTELRAALDWFYAQTSPESLIPLVRRPDVIAPLITYHYKETAPKPSMVLAFENPRRERVDGLVLQAVDVRLDNTIGQRTVYAESTDEGVKVDWESAVSYQPLSWKDYQEQKPPYTTFIRAIVQRSSFAEPPFNNPQIWRSYLLTHPLETRTFHGYARIDSDAEFLLNDKLRDTATMSEFIVGLRYPVPAEGQEIDATLVEISEVISDSWVVDYPEGEPHFDLRSH